MTIACKPFEFIGRCHGCGRNSSKGRVAVAVMAADDVDPGNEFDGTWLCLPCARRLRKRLAEAINRALSHFGAGREYRNGRWQPKARLKQ